MIVEKILNIIFAVVIAFTIFSLIEWIGSHFFWATLFNFGIPLYRRSENIQFTVEPRFINTVVRRNEGKFKFISRKTCLFISQIKFFAFFRFQTPFSQFKCRADFNYNRIEITARIPLGITFFTIETLILINYALSIDRNLALLIASTMLFILFIAVILFIEYRRVKIMVGELKEMLSSSPTK